MESAQHDKKQQKIMSRGLKKVVTYYNEVLFTQHFFEFVRKTRARFQIPENGYNLEEALDKNQPSDWKTRFQFPSVWLRDPNVDRKKYQLKDVRTSVELFLKQHDLNPDYCYDYAMNYLFYNDFFVADVCEIRNLSLYGKWAQNMGKFKKRFYQDIGLEWLSEYSYKKHPVEILISPYASERDILDFVKKNYAKKIKPIQDNHKNPSIQIGKLRKRDNRIRLRNEFIYLHEGHPLKQIVKCVAKKFGNVLDEGHIAKILSMERKRRKQV